MDYLFEQLGDERFQKLCQAIISESCAGFQCLPVGQPDGGRDGFVRLKSKDGDAGFIVFQVKFVKNPSSRESRDLIEQVIKTEEAKVKKLIEMGAQAYHLMTNAVGTAHLDSGSIDKVNALLEDAFGIETFCWWRDDISRKIDGSNSLKWSYPEILRATDLLGELLQVREDPEKKRRADALRAYMAVQARYDSQLKFKQIELQKDIVDLFVDVPANFLAPVNEAQRNGQLQLAESIGAEFPEGYSLDEEDVEEFGEVGELESFGALWMMARPEFSKAFGRVVVEGAPGQGKSTVTQYLCQVNRMVLLNRVGEVNKIDVAHIPSLARVPFRVDLRDYASWLSGRDPFSKESAISLSGSCLPLLESFLAAQVNRSTGSIFSVDDLTAVSKYAHILVVLDGFDEVADVALRGRIVSEVSSAADRIFENALSAQIIVTSRPAAFANSPGFPRDEWQHLKLLPLTRPVIDLYAGRWLDGRLIDNRERSEILSVLSEKLQHSHVSDLARNPMQLAILLSLISVQGASLPDKRTALYDGYMSIFLNRETEKSTVVRDHRDLLIQIHRFLAWTLQSEAEALSGAGNISEKKLRDVLKSYLELEGHSTQLVDELFSGMVERVVALVSRVQGTFEFEVQPLREYFAARYLYDTAPYAPVGSPCSGTLPERFDAIARNFYWLNVTRFYSGCYSTGELSSLVDGLEELSQSEEFKYIGHPARLGFTLIKDCVFSQQPKLATRLVCSIINNESFRVVLSDAWYAGGRDYVIVPSGLAVARKELIDKCLMLIEPEFAGDVRYAAAKLLSIHCDYEYLLEVWKSFLARPTHHDAAVQIGSTFGVFDRISKEEALEVVDLLGGGVSSSMIRTHRVDLLKGGFSSFHQAYFNNSLDALGGHLYLASRYSDDFSIEITILALIDLLVSPFFYSRVSEGEPEEQVVELVSLGSHRGLEAALSRVFREKEERRENGEDGFFHLMVCVCNYYEASAFNVRNDFEIGMKLVEAARGVWGGRWSLCVLAMNFARMLDSLPLVSSDITDRQSSLCAIACSARRNKDNREWWGRQIELVETGVSLDRLFLLGLICRWMPVDILLEYSDRISPHFDALSEKEWIHTMMEQRYGEYENGSESDLGRMPEKMSPRVASLIATKSGLELRFLIWGSYLKDYIGSDKIVLDISVGILIDYAVKNNDFWDIALEGIRKAYKLGCLFHIHRVEYASGERKPIFSADVARKVCENLSAYPLDVVNYAERILSTQAGASAVPVGKIAIENKWFELPE